MVHLRLSSFHSLIYSQSAENLRTLGGKNYLYNKGLEPCDIYIYFA